MILLSQQVHEIIILSLLRFAWSNLKTICFSGIVSFLSGQIESLASGLMVGSLRAFHGSPWEKKTVSSWPWLYKVSIPLHVSTQTAFSSTNISRVEISNKRCPREKCLSFLSLPPPVPIQKMMVCFMLELNIINFKHAV